MFEIPKIVRERLQSPGMASDSHPDPNVLTAFAEQLLSRAERSTVLEHLSRCDDCREILALAVPASEPAQVGLAKTSASWFAWPRIRWAFASAALVVGGAIGFLEYGHHTQSVRMAKNTEVPAAIHAYQEPAPPPETEKTADGQSAQSQTAQGSKALVEKDKLIAVEKPKDGPSYSAPTALMARNYRNPAIGGRLAHGPSQTNQWQQQNNAPSAKQQSAGAVASVPGAISEMVQVQAQPAREELKSETTDSLVAANRISAQPRAADAEVSRAKSVPAAPLPVSSDIQAQGRAVQAVLSNPTWTITFGRLERSFDQGATWQDVNVNASSDTGASLELTFARKVPSASQKQDKKEQPAPVVFRAVAANGLEVWAGGTSSALYHSLDAGVHWSRVIPTSANASMTGDVLTLDFPEPHKGRISTSTGETWTTADNGQTWQKQ